MNHQLKSMTASELSLRIQATRGASAYWVYLVDARDAKSVTDELEEYCRVFGENTVVRVLASRNAVQLLRELPTSPEEILVVDATGFGAKDWQLLDVRRSDLSHEGIVVFIATAASFDELMHVAPNLASWLGGLVFSRDDGTGRMEEIRHSRLEALGRWAGKTDEDIIREAEQKTLPRDPEYGEWLTLLGRGDLLDG